MLVVHRVLWAVLVTQLVQGLALPTEKKNTLSFGNVNVDNIITNERLLNHFISCILDKVKCTPEGTEIKKFIPDALESACSICTENQKEFSLKMFRHLYRNRKTAFEELAKKFDPTGVYTKRYFNTAMKLLEENRKP